MKVKTEGNLMHYVAYIDRVNRTNNEVDTILQHHISIAPAQVYRYVEKHTLPSIVCANDAVFDIGTKVTVYPCTDSANGMIRAALFVAGCTARNALLRGYTFSDDDIERTVEMTNEEFNAEYRKKADSAIRANSGNSYVYRICSEFASLNSGVYNINDGDLILDLMSDYSQDMQDYFGVAMNAIVCAIGNGETDVRIQIKQAFKELNAYVKDLAGATNEEMSAEYLTDEYGESYVLDAAMRKMIAGEYDNHGDYMDVATAQRLSRKLAVIWELLTPIERKIIKGLYKKHSVREIARRMNRDAKTVREHVVHVREKAMNVLNGTEFESLMHSEQLREQIAVTHERLKTERRKAKQHMYEIKTQAERAKRYRDKKMYERFVSEIDELLIHKGIADLHDADLRHIRKYAVKHDISELALNDLLWHRLEIIKNK